MRAEEKQAALKNLNRLVNEFREKYGVGMFMIASISEKIPSGETEQWCTACICGDNQEIIEMLSSGIKSHSGIRDIIQSSLLKSGIKKTTIKLFDDLSRN